ncbi:unnamed protein product [Trichobilharzia szidati]|nr:unnamed protein product [Trichobilharzia szidati]
MGYCKSSFGYKHLQIALIISNLIILGCALCIIAVDGIFYYAVRVHSDNLHGTVKGIITCVAIVGCFMILVGFLGLFGSCLHSADILSLYAVGLLCIILLHLGTGIACLCYQLEMWNSLHLVISNAVKNYHSDKNTSVLLDKIHRDVFIFVNFSLYSSFNVVEHGPILNMVTNCLYHARKMVVYISRVVLMR